MESIIMSSSKTASLILSLVMASMGQSSLATLSGRFPGGACAEAASPENTPWGFARESLHDGAKGSESGRSGSGSVRIVLREISSDRALQETVPGSDGSFAFRSVPFAAYRLEAIRGGAESGIGGYVLAVREIVIDNALTVNVDLSCGAGTDAVSLPERVVRAEGSLSPLEMTGHSFFTSEEIRGLLVPSREKAAEAVLLQSADVVPDEDGRLHARGEDAQVQYVVDGIPWSGNPTRVYSSLFNADVAKSIDVRAGGLPAQYAAGSAVVSVTTRDGLDRPFSLRAGAGAASFGTREIQAVGSGRLGEYTGLFVSAARSGSDRYLDPVSGFDPIHAGGDGAHLFGKLSVLAGADIQFHVLGAYDAGGYEVPNSLSRTPAQDQGQELRSYLAGARLEAGLGGSAHLAAAVYTRRAEAKLTSGGLSRIGSAADSLRALGENERFFIGASRENGYHGGQIELTARPAMLGGGHRIRAGVSGEINPLVESLSFAVTDSALADAQTDNRFKPYDISRNGRSLTADEKRTGSAVSAYVQDGFEIGKWSFLPGLRYDAFDLFETELAFSPRLAAAYAVNRDLDLRASLDWLAARAPLENILMSSSPALRPLSGDDQGTIPATVGAQRAIALDLGADWRYGRYLVFDAGAYGKYLTSFLVKAELGASGLIFPVNLKRGVVAGGLFTVHLREWKRLSGSLSAGGCASLGLKPDDGSSPIAAGLLVGEEGHNYGHPFAGEDFFPTEHNQIATAVLNLRYRLPMGLAATFGGRFDSGLPFDLVGQDGMALDEGESRAELARRGYSEDVIDLLSLEPEEPGSPDKSVAPHATFDLGMEYRLPMSGVGLEVRAAVLNVLDTPYLYKFESSFGSTHFGQTRTVGLWLAMEY
ncbi:MAG: TonB-dependent receptor [Fibrobacteres bacterium]|nr:TonB-dependent receptor [Fibrobacterota bacterium]